MDTKIEDSNQINIGFILKFFLIFLELFVFIFVVYRSQEIKPSNELYISEVIDGDTFKLSNSDIIRLLCVDTPEENNKGYEEAKFFLEDLVLYKTVNKEVKLINPKENINDYLDKYKRKLRFVYFYNEKGTEIFVNQEIINQGYGELFIYNNSIECRRITLLNNSS
jgi:endonuclease YncB( thermonuclease family)